MALKPSENTNSGTNDLEALLNNNTQQTQNVESNNNNNNGGLLILGNLVNGSVELHQSKMKELLSHKGIEVTAITQLNSNLDYPLIVYSILKDKTIFYYPTIVVDDAKKGPSIHNFIDSLISKDSKIIYAPDAKYEDEIDGGKVRAILMDKYGKQNCEQGVCVGVSVAYYNTNTYSSIDSYVHKLLLGGIHRAAGLDQNINFDKTGMHVNYTNIESGKVMTDTGLVIRADWSLGLTIPTSNNSDKASKNELSMEYVTVYGYIDAIIVEENAPMVPGQYMQIPVKVNKLSPTIVITYIKGASALPGYGMMGLITSAIMTRFDMYFGYIFNHVNKYQDILNILLGGNIDFSKMTAEEKFDILSKNITNPYLCIDIPNNGYMEELNFLIKRLTREAEFKKYAKRFLNGIDFTANMVLGDVPQPLAEVFDKEIKDSRAVDVVNIATKSKDKSYVIGLGKYTTDMEITNSNPNSIADTLNIIKDAGIDGTLLGTVARVFLSQEGMNFLTEQSGIKPSFRKLFEGFGGGIPGIMTRDGGFTNAVYGNANQGGTATNNLIRTYLSY